MNEPYDPQQTVPPDQTPDPSQTVDERPADPLEVALGVAFGPDSGLPYTLDSGLLVGLERRLRAAEAGPHQPATLPTPRTFEPAVADRYELFGEIGRGGMGAVLRGRDPSLGRDLAVKVLLEKNQAYPEVVQRFVEEAQIGGQLQHPGVVPVYELGRFGDGRPYFTMKLVKGRTLAALLAERADPAQERPRFLGIFLQVCQTLAYAHSKGVIHRDLKPSNVMVGAFGEVQVMDWGLAKVLAPGGPAGAEASSLTGGETVIRTTRTDSGGSESEAGYAIGTPSYMAPEQALGQIELVDQRSDVFGLGAVLCELLTNQPPYEGAQGAAVLRRAARADLREAFARLDASGADGELLALAKHCLAPEPTDRPRDAGEVAGILGAYLEGIEQRLRAAQIERATAEARAEEAKGRAVLERRARRLTGWLAAAGLLLVLGGGGGAWLWEHQRAAREAEAAHHQHERAAREAEEALHQHETNEAVRLAMSEARLKSEQARSAPLTELGKYGEALSVAQKARELARTGQASEEVLREAEELAVTVKADWRAAEKDRRLLTRLLDICRPREMLVTRRDGSGTFLTWAALDADEQFAAAFRDWGLDVDATPTEEAAARLKERPVAVTAAVAAALAGWVRERVLERRPAPARGRLLDLAAALDSAPDSRRRELWQILRRDNRLWRERLLRELSEAVMPWSALAGPVPGTVRHRLRKLARNMDLRKESLLVIDHTALALWLVGDQAEAVRHLRSAVAARPGEPILLVTLANLLESHDPPRWQEAIECYAAVRAVRPEVGMMLAETMARAGRASEGREVMEDLVRREREDPVLHFYLGRALARVGELAAAGDAYRKAIELKPDFAEAYYNLGNTLIGQNQRAEAETAYRKALELKPKWAEAYNNLGIVLGELGRLPEAEKALRTAIALKPDYADAHYNLGYFLDEQKKLPQAEEAYRQAIKLRPGFSEAHNHLGIVLERRGRLPEAVAACRRATEFDPANAQAHFNLGLFLERQGKYPEAEAALRTAIALRPEDVEAHTILGAVLCRQGRLPEGETALRKALRIKPDHAEAHFNLGVFLGRQGKSREAEAAFREVIKQQPRDHEAHQGLGAALQAQGKFAEAADAFRKMLEVAPPGHPAGEEARKRIALCRRLITLEAKLPGILKGDIKPASAADLLDLAGLCQRCRQRYHAAARLYTGAFAAEPAFADDLRQQHRYNAACAAALVAAAKGEDARGLSDTERAKWRRQALDWLREDLTAWSAAVEDSPPQARPIVQRVLSEWRNDANLASVRDEKELAGLPEAERQGWRKLWADVDELRRKAERK